MEILSCGMWDLVFWPEIEPRPPALGEWTLSHWTTREVPNLIFLRFGSKCVLGMCMCSLSKTLATWCEELTHLKRPWCWESLRAGGEGHDRGWGDWMASPTRWTWAWVSSGSWWWTGGPDLLQSMVSQRVRHDWATELNWTEAFIQSQFSSTAKTEPLRSLLNDPFIQWGLFTLSDGH